MPLPPALQAKLAKRGILQAGGNRKEPEEEIIAEDYDDQMQTDECSQAASQEQGHEEVAGCPNKWNIYHECQSFCNSQWSQGTAKPSNENERRRKRMLRKFPLTYKWEEVYDSGTGRYYYWNTENDEVSWLPPNHPRTKIGPCASKLRKMIRETELSKKSVVGSDGESNSSDSEEEREILEPPRKVHRHQWQEKGKARGRRQTKDNDLDPMDPSSYSDVPRGSWASGLENQIEAKTGVDVTASGPLYQMRPYPSPGAVLRANASNQK